MLKTHKKNYEKTQSPLFTTECVPGQRAWRCFQWWRSEFLQPQADCARINRTNCLLGQPVPRRVTAEIGQQLWSIENNLCTHWARSAMLTDRFVGVNCYRLPQHNNRAKSNAVVVRFSQTMAQQNSHENEHNHEFSWQSPVLVSALSRCGVCHSPP